MSTIFERLDALEASVNSLNTDYNHLNGQLVSVEETVEVMLQNIDEIRGMIGGCVSDKTESINNADLNELYGRLIIAYGNSCKNRPSGLNGYLINIPHDKRPTVYNKQIWITRAPNNIYVRNMDGEVWGEWTALNYDSGWKELPLTEGVSPHNEASFPCRYRKIGNVVYIEGCVKGFKEVEKVVANVPEGYRVNKPYYMQNATNGGNVDTYNMTIEGNITRVSTTFPVSSLAESNYHFLNTSYVVD